MATTLRPSDLHSGHAIGSPSDPERRITDATIGSIPVDPRARRERELKDQAAVARCQLWTRIGAPVANMLLPEAEYKRDYLDRYCMSFAFISQKAEIEQLEGVQAAKKKIFCPACIDVDNLRCITKVTALYIRIMDDPMTTFPALGHFQCHRCGFEEYHPLKADPRKKEDEERFYNQERMKYEEYRNYSAQQALRGGAAQGLGNALGGIDPYAGLKMTQQEAAALYRQFQNAVAKQAPQHPPMIKPKP